MILNPSELTPRCTATVDLLSAVLRPYNFRVTVIGEYPHAFRRTYTVIAPGDLEAAENSAAMKGMELFVREFTRPLPGVASIVPRVQLA